MREVLARIRQAIPWIALFLVIFAVGLLYFFPLETLVRGQLDSLQQQTGLSIQWSEAKWSLWHTSLVHVTVQDPSGQQLVSLDTLDIRPSGATLQAEGHAAWGDLQAWARPNDLEVHLNGYPMGEMENVPLKDGKLSAQLHYQPADGGLHGTFNLSGQAHLPVGYQGPVTVGGLINFQGKAGQLAVDIYGDRLRAKGDLDMNSPSGGLRDLSVSGPLKVELKGNTIRLSITAGAGRFSAQPTL